MADNDDKRPLISRAGDIHSIIRTVQTGKSCILVGVAGIGKTTLMRELLSATVREQYLASEKDRFIFLLLDANELSKPSALAYYRQMALLLEPVLARYHLPFSSNENILAVDNEEIVRKLLFDRVEAIVTHCEQCRLVFLLDRFEVAFTETEPQFFRVLQSLRSRSNGQVCYVAASTNVPMLICDEQHQRVVREMFPELFNGNIYGIKPPSGQDMQALLDQGLLYHQASLRLQLLEITGGHPGLLKAVMTVWNGADSALTGHDPQEQIIHKLLQETTIVSQCEQIWYSLSETEQYCLKQIRRGLFSQHGDAPPFSMRQIQYALHMLALKGIIREEHRSNKSYQPFSSLFASYVAQQFSAGLPGLQLDLLQQQVWIDGTLRASHLTNKEFRLLRFLAEHSGRVCSREETTRAVYGDMYNPKRDDARLDALVERTRKSIGDDARPPRFIETVRGAGHRLHEYLGEHF
ncbi:hypothetical protein KSF_019300 [Reticulibacter mediterranei]|uniref:OmpR/PhoB-type domain-containing protein n=1 Tax=Reticulibacter mediterranei TaxID=2778369 RepID=A0A8J3MZG3_9CHLR|nr:winged helix-turn-helix domain-containing protein [Reticulibacter mediterranei]GHO91882.1 hypothetical protein KSF_019300 [Reticulibacter mediterranei]